MFSIIELAVIAAVVLAVVAAENRGMVPVV